MFSEFAMAIASEELSARTYLWLILNLAIGTHSAWFCSKI